jgi:histidinol-phosphate aminotransferase
MAAYIPGEQPAAGVKVIKLNTNENPYPPSPKAIEALRSIDPDSLRRYPHPFAGPLRQQAAQVLDVPAEWIVAGNGSDDLLAMIVLACADHGRKVVYPMPTYVLYRTLGDMQDAQCVEIPFDEDYNLPVEQLIAQQGAVTFIASPNSPSGTLAQPEQLEELARRLQGVLVVDEAYTDFADGNAMELVKRHKNVIVLRTFSKGYSLAGLRLGFGVMQPSLSEGIGKVRDSYPVDALACAIGAAAIQDQAYKNECAQKVKTSRAQLAQSLQKLNFKVWPSQANFLLAQVPAKFNGKSVYEALKARAILVRYFNEPRLDDKLRITVGTEEQNDALVAALNEILKQPQV